jgi:hypothetical protein
LCCCVNSKTPSALTTSNSRRTHVAYCRRAYAEESQQLLRKQQAVMDKLRRENDSLKSGLAVEFRQFKKPNEAGLADRVLKLQDQVHRCM